MKQYDADDTLDLSPKDIEEINEEIKKLELTDLLPEDLESVRSHNQICQGLFECISDLSGVNDDSKSVRSYPEICQVPETDHKPNLSGFSEAPDNIKINSLDRKLFSLLLTQKYLTYFQIVRWLDPTLLNLSGEDKWRSSLYRRVRRLVRAKYIVTKKIGPHNLYLLSEKGILETANPYQITLPNVSEFSTHDLLISDLRYYLEAKGATCWWSHNEMMARADLFWKIPDAYFVLNTYKIFLKVGEPDPYSVFRGGNEPQKVLNFYTGELESLLEKTSIDNRYAFFPWNPELPNEWEGTRPDRSKITLEEFLQ